MSKCPEGRGDWETREAKASGPHILFIPLTTLCLRGGALGCCRCSGRPWGALPGDSVEVRAPLLASWPSCCLSHAHLGSERRTKLGSVPVSWVVPLAPAVSVLGWPGGDRCGWGTCHGVLGRAVWLQIPAELLKNKQTTEKKGRKEEKDNHDSGQVNSSQVPAPPGPEHLVTETPACRRAVCHL